MNKWILTIFVVVCLTSCSSEPSAQEKRNNFDKCVIETLAKKLEGESFSVIRDYRDQFEDISKQECAYHLK